MTVHLARDEAMDLAREAKRLARLAATRTAEATSWIPDDVLELPLPAVVDFLRAQRLEPVVRDLSGRDLTYDQLTGQERLVSVEPAVEITLPTVTVVVLVVEPPPQTER